MSQVTGPTQRRRRPLGLWLTIGAFALLVAAYVTPVGFWLIGLLLLVTLVECGRRGFSRQAGAGRKSVFAFGALVALLGILVWVFWLTVALDRGFD
jgi:energy-coupling factor transporter transmembrane protein EcfT